MLRITTIVFALAYISALFVWLTGTFGWFGQEPDPLSGVFLVPLGLPWVLLVDRAPEALWPVLSAAAPGITLALLTWLAVR